MRLGICLFKILLKSIPTRSTVELWLLLQDKKTWIFTSYRISLSTITLITLFISQNNLFDKVKEIFSSLLLQFGYVLKENSLIEDALGTSLEGIAIGQSTNSVVSSIFLNEFLSSALSRKQSSVGMSVHLHKNFNLIVSFKVFMVGHWCFAYLLLIKRPLYDNVLWLKFWTLTPILSPQEDPKFSVAVL